MRDEKYKYYNSGNSLGIVGVIPQHEDGEYTFLLNRTPDYTWIKTEDLYYSREEAQKSPIARFLRFK